jgi:VanZ family protein
MANPIGPNPRTAKLWQIVLAGYWLLLFAATHVPRSVATVPGGRVDDMAHFLTYAVLAGLLAITWQQSAGRLTIRHLRWAWIALAAYAAFDELTQIPVGRTASWSDWLADVLGALAGLTLFAGWSRWRLAAQ